MPSADEVVAAYRESLGRDPDASEIASELDNASRYGDDWFQNQFRENLEERSAATASAGGSGGDLDLDGNGVIDSGWMFFDDGGNADFIRVGETATREGDSYDLGGTVVASEFIPAIALLEVQANAATEQVRKEIDRLNLTGAFNDGNGQSAAGIAAVRASTNAAIAAAKRGKLNDILGYASSTIAASSSQGGTGGALTTRRSVLPAPSTSAAARVTTASGGAPGTAVATSYRDPTQTVEIVEGEVLTGGANPQSGSGLVLMAALALGAYFYFK